MSTDATTDAATDTATDTVTDALSEAQSNPTVPSTLALSAEIQRSTSEPLNIYDRDTEDEDLYAGLS